MDEAFEAVTGNSVWALALASVAGVAIIGGRQAKPLARTAIKGFLGGRAWVQERFAETGERLQDLYAEAKYEYQSELAAAADTATKEPTPARRGGRRIITPAEATSA